MEDHGTRLLVKVAQLYHLQGLNQDQIGRQLGVSRSKVSRMLKDARERGLVEISIHYPARFSLELERRLESELGLREAIVVSSGGSAGSQEFSSVAGAASDYLLRVLQPGDALGVSGGQTVALAAQVMPASAACDITVVQLGTAAAYLGERIANSSAEVALQVAQKLGSMDSLVLIPIPSVLDTETIRDALLRDTGVRRAMARLASCTVALVGIGSVDATSAASEEANSADGQRKDTSDQPGRRRQLLPATPEEDAELRDAGAAGEICARFFDIEGRPCVTSLDRRMVALDLAQLRAVPLVIGVASGRQKAAAILGAARGGYVKSLVTDDLTALAALELTGDVSRPATRYPGGKAPSSQTTDSTPVGQPSSDRPPSSGTQPITGPTQRAHG